ncbi:hypothetical protein HK100_009560, partial [Physocladia obscura]
MQKQNKSKQCGHNWRPHEIDNLLDVIKDILASSSNEWEQVRTCYFAFGYNQDVEALKSKFKKLQNHKKPTGNPTCPLQALCAKQAGQKINEKDDTVVLDDDTGADSKGNWEEFSQLVK